MGVWVQRVQTALFGVSVEQVRGATGRGAGQQDWRAREQARMRQLDNNGAVASDGRVPVWLGGG